MSNLIASVTWCWLQVLLVAITATVLSRLTLRRSPTAGATIAWSGIVATLAVTAMVFVPLPKQAIAKVAGNLAMGQSHVNQSAISQRVQKSPGGRVPADDSSDPSVPQLPFFGLLIKSLRTSESAIVQHRGAASWVLRVLAMGSAIGLLRWLTGLAAIARLCRHSVVVSDHDASSLITELIPHLPLRHAPQLRETNLLSSAAVVGWWRPVVMLPADWREWSPGERKAVLAHELAHIARHDALWRMVAAFTVALHWGQPLMHWLRRQFLLAQELAADELASTAMGSQREYLLALAKLALRQDRRPVVAPHAALLPVFSGFLLRRIVMLRAMDGSTRRDQRRLTQGTALAAVAAVACLAVAMRGLAEPPEIQTDGSIRVARATDVKPKPAAAAADAGFFQRPSIDIAKMALVKNGGSLVRLGEILQQPRFAQAAAKYDQWLLEGWTKIFPGAEPPPCSLRDIEYIVGDCMLSGRYAKPPQEEVNPHPHQLMFGWSYGFIRWQQPVAEIFAWLQRTPGAELKQHDEIPYVELPLGLLGPEKVCVGRIDTHTLLWAGGESTFLKRLDTFVAATDPPAWHDAWNEVAGGLFTAVAAETKYTVPEETDQTEADKLTRDFFKKTRLLAVGLDWQPGEHGAMTYKIHGRYDNEADARSMEAATRRALELAIQETREDAGKAKELKDKIFNDLLIALLQGAQIETSQTENGWQINLHLHGPFDIESNL